MRCACSPPRRATGVDRAARIVPVREEQLKERLGERFRELDVPLLVEWPDGRREALLFVLEEESEGRRFSIHRLAHYCLDLSEMLRTERVVPVAVFLRRAGQPGELILGGDRHRYLAFRYLSFTFTDRDWKDFRESENIVARLNLPNMRCPADERVAAYAWAIRGLLALEPDPERRIKYLEYVDIYAHLSEDELRRFQLEYPQESKTMSTFASRFEERGFRAGEERGLRAGEERGFRAGEERGLRRGQAAVLLRQMERKFGPPPEAVRQRIEEADGETLLAWSERILTAERIEDVLH